MIGFILPAIFIALCVLSIWYAVDTTADGGSDATGIVWRDVTDDFLAEHRPDSPTR